jgi:FlaA1/EpsC-like NDP-sugar epimerase
MMVRSRQDQQIEPRKSFTVRHRFLLSVILHGILFALALFSAFLVAWNFSFRAMQYWLPHLYLPLLLLALPAKLFVFHWTRQYDASWRYVSLRDLFSVSSASLISSFVFLTMYFAIDFVLALFLGHKLIDTGTGELHRLRQSSVFGLDVAATIAFVCGAKILVRFYHEELQAGVASDFQRVLIVGAGDSGEALLREILRMRPHRYECVGFVDDHVHLPHGLIHGVEVLGRTEDLARLCQEHAVDEVLIAIPSASPKLIRELVGQCEGTNVLFRTVPAISDLIEGRVTVSQFREVDIADLLGREEVELDTDKIGAQLRGKIALVTGAGGSIGSEMCRQIAKFQPKRLVLLEQAENNLFEIDWELRRTHPELDTVPYVADIVDRVRLDHILQYEKPSVVFHAAAHKHVPMMELNPGEAIKNNVTGTMTVAGAVVAAGVSRMVVISTDKAVNPTSIMGCTKRVAEMYVQGLSSRSGTQFVTVRFGNVLGSSGSVVPIFREQIAKGGPLTVTHPEMTRYFMTIPEAAQLVLQAGTMGKGGEIYVLHMGQPVKIVDLARDMITLSGLTLGTDLEIKFTGVRPGEKLYEELMSTGEHVGDTSHPKIGIWKHRVEDWDALLEGIEDLKQMSDGCPNGQIKAKLAEIVPEYRPGPPVERETADCRSVPAPAASQVCEADQPGA